MVICRCGDVKVYHPEKVSESYSVVETPASEFMLEIITIKKGEKVVIPVIPVPRVLIGFSGVGVTESGMSVK